MENYMDDSFAVIDNTIISYSGQHSAIKVPQRFGNIDVLSIGNGSFMESQRLQCVVLPPKIKKIGTDAFFYCPYLSSIVLPGSVCDVGSSAFGRCKSLSDITIYDLELTVDEYLALKSAANRSNDGIYVSCEIPQKELIQKIVFSMSCASPAQQVPKNISSLFSMATLDEKNGNFSLDKNLPVIGFSMPSAPISENKAFCDHIKNGNAEIYHKQTEQKNDWHVRVGSEPFKTKTIIFTFDDSITKEANGKIYINAMLRIGYFFWQSAQPVILNNKKYYVYRRHYLSCNPEMKYIRQDIAVYTDKGVVNNRKEAQDVYAKYKLLSIL